MTYTFKISRRLARLRAPSFAVLAASFLTLSCTDEQSTGPSTLPSESPTGVSVSPNSVTMGPNQAMQFQASVDNTSGLLSTSNGGKGRGRMRRSVIDLSVTPHTLTIAEGSAASFSVTGTLADSSTVQPSVTWAATGGVIDANGKFTAGSVPGNFTVSATASSGIADTAAIVITDAVPAPTNLSLSPTSASLPVGGSKRFVATGTSSDGRTVAVGARYAATGGTISPDGLYQAGQTPGTFKVIATDTLTSLSDTAPVIIEPPPATLQALVLTPSTASLAAGATQQFTVTGKMSDGTTAAVTVSWSATGGSISSGGLYTAGQAGGSFRVIAQDPNTALADTAVVNVAVPVSTSPPPTGGKTFFSADAESGSVVPPWSFDASCCGGTTQPVGISTDMAKNGTHSFKFEKSTATVLASIEGKSQILSSSPQSPMCGQGKYCTGWYSTWVYLDSGFDEAGWEMLLGWMAGGVNGAGVDPISHIGLELVNGQLQLIYYLKNGSPEAGNYAAPDIAGYSRVGGEYRMTSGSPAGIVAFPKGQWVHLAVYYKMARSNGQVTVYQNGTKIMDLTAPTMNTYDGFQLFNNSAGNMILQFGIYSGTRTRTQRLYADDFLVTDYRPTP